MANLPSLPAVYALTVLDQTAAPDVKITPGAFTLYSNNGVPTILMSSGTSINLSTGGGGGGLTSVGLSDGSTSPLYNVSGSPGNPLTSNGTLSFTLKSQGANLVVASPDGTSGQPTARALVTTDIPALPASKITSGTFTPSLLPVFGASGASHAIGAVPDPGASAGTTRFLREDATWAVPAAGGGATFSTLSSNTTMPTAGGDVIYYCTSTLTLTVTAQTAGARYTIINDGATTVTVTFSTNAQSITQGSLTTTTTVTLGVNATLVMGHKGSGSVWRAISTTANVTFN